MNRTYNVQQTDNVKIFCEKPVYMIIVTSGAEVSAGGGALRPAKEKLCESSLLRQSPVKPEAVKSLISP